MDEVEEQALSVFGNYLESLPRDVQLLLDALVDEDQPLEMRRVLAGALNYLFKSLDLIDDGIEGLGFLDDAFVVRQACALAAQHGELPDELGQLAQEAEFVSAFLGEHSGRLRRFVLTLRESTVRGRSVDTLLSDVDARGELTGDVVSWAASYKKPKFVLDERGLIKLRAFLGAKLPD